MADETFSSTALIEIELSIKHLFSSYPSPGRNPDLDIEFFCDEPDNAGNEDAGIPVLTVTLTGTWLNKSFAGVSDDAIIPITLTPLGTYAEGVLVTTDTAINISITIPDEDALTGADFIIQGLKSNWVKWSNIGEMNFTVDKSNVAGERPMDWKGWVRCIKKLGSRAVTYGKNGVTVLTPSGVNWGMKTVHKIGTKGKNAVAGNESIHFFIDNKSQLFSLGESLEKLDYSEYLTVLGSSVVMHYDAESDLVYICDGTYGFVYSPKDESLGKGPVNIAGLGSQDGTLYVTAPAAITTPAFEVCTDIYDLGSRNCKTIQSVEFGTDTDETLYGSIDYRKNTSDSFSQSSWKIVHGNGVLWQTVFGREFRFRLKILTYDYLELDYIKVKGVMHEN